MAKPINKPNKYLAKAISNLLIKHLENKADDTVTDDPELEKLKDYLLWQIINKKQDEKITGE